MSNGLDRETSLAALQALSDADLLISKKLHTQNEFRKETIQKMCDDLGVVVKEVKV